MYAIFNVLVLNSKHLLKLVIYMVMKPANKKNKKLDSTVVVSN